MRYLITVSLVLGVAWNSLASEIHTLEPAEPAPKTAPAGQPADHAAILHPDQLQTLVEAQGIVDAVDPSGHTLQIKDTVGHLLAVHPIPNTRIIDQNNHVLALSELKSGDHIRLYYNRSDFTVQQIDRLPTVTDAILGK